ncbi:MAG: hypothetical protein HFJ27_01965 [Clostridia bacterium]|nr:hypothetical protein [Clostridia bacterium]
MENLLKYVNELKNRSKYKNQLDSEVLKNSYHVYPFNQFEYMMSHFLAEGLLTIEDYYKIRNEYLEKNKYLYIFEYTGPRTFGENWAQNHLNQLVPELKKPNKKYDKTYSGEYDFWLDAEGLQIKIEVKASRAVRKEKGCTKQLITKALASNSIEPFDMNFQQIKPHCCDVFVWIAVWRDVIKYWVLSSKDVEENSYYSKGQHRGNAGEGQLWIKESNIHDFDKYLVQSDGLLNAILDKAQNK